MKANVLGLNGSAKQEIALPRVFSYAYKPIIILRAVLGIQSANKQPQGLKPYSGMNYAAEYEACRFLPANERIMNTGHARLPRLKNRGSLLAGRVATVSQAVGGPKAHPPKVEKVLEEKVNKKEKKAALYSAVACTVNKKLVGGRHAVSEKIALPIVVAKEFEDLDKTKKVVDALKAFNVYSDIESAKGKRKLRAGKGKKRGRKYKIKKSILIVTGNNAKVYKAARNLSGVDVCNVNSLNVDLLAPGGVAGRLTLWSEDAIKAMEKWV